MPAPSPPARLRAAAAARPALAASAGVWSATFVCFLGIGASLTVLPRYVQGPIGAGDGVVVGAFTLAAVVGRPIGGRLADAHGRRRILVVGLLISAVASAMYLLPLGVAGLVVARLVLGLGDGWVFTAGACFAAAVVGARLLFRTLPDRLGPRRTAAVAGIAEALGLALIAAAQSFGAAVAGAVVMGVGFSLLFPSLALIAVARVGPARRGAALGAFTAFFDAGVGIGAPLAGAVAALGGYAAAFWMASVCAALGVAMSVVSSGRASREIATA